MRPAISAAPPGTDGIRLSVIVPLAPGEPAGQQLFAQLARLPAGTEVIVVRADGGAGPLLPPAGPGPVFRDLATAPGRAGQMNAGARLARGSWLWFLHADSRMLPDTLDGLLAFLARDQPALGYFNLHFDDGPWRMRLNAWGANRRSRWLGLPFGDQGLLMPAALFAECGGYDESAAYGEDHLLVWRARALGVRPVPVGAALGTSARKYVQLGWWRTSWRHVRLTVAQAWPQWRGRHRSDASRGGSDGWGAGRTSVP
ncbi:MAG: glycosyltransferase family 2 protein [Xanthomonadaceae bacterium]|nr:glycosyltransferase family 2 protein [Xanthomonadaceae bacterium]MDE2278138.1 glycosyltransferase family 2 protein [Xanthomonadaceae bacterium]MDE2316514.1 glycosyltransferase family 2 protein [Xanthomonadaceae bacterium]